MICFRGLKVNYQKKDMELIDNKYFIGELSFEGLVEKYGTPLYVYDTSSIDNQISLFKDAFKGLDLRINYACKANTNLSLLRYMNRQGLCLDTVSLQEVEMGLATGFGPGEIIFTPNCVNFEEIVQGVHKGVNINIENISNLKKFAQKYGGSVPVCIRLNPHIAAQATSDKVDWWHKQSKFGISIDQINEVKDIETQYNLNINGIHIHSSSVILNPEVFINGAKAVFEIAGQFENLEFIDFGGGIKVDVGDGNKAIDIISLGRGFKPVFEEFCKGYGRRLQIWFEPGRFLMMNAGTLIAKCVVLKRNGGTDFVGVDTGLNHLIRPMMYGAYHAVKNLSNPAGELKKYTVVGNICEIDNLAVDRDLSEVREGDLIAIENAGAYGYSMASNYNSRFRPAEILVHQNKDYLIRKRDTYEDLIRGQVDIRFD